MEKKHYILIGALALVVIAIIFVNAVNFGEKTEKVNFGFEKYTADMPQKPLPKIDSYYNDEVSEPVKLYTTCSS